MGIRQPSVRHRHLRTCRHNNFLAYDLVTCINLSERHESGMRRWACPYGEMQPAVFTNESILFPGALVFNDAWVVIELVENHGSRGWYNSKRGSCNQKRTLFIGHQSRPDKQWKIPSSPTTPTVVTFAFAITMCPYRQSSTN